MTFTLCRLFAVLFAVLLLGGCARPTSPFAGPDGKPPNFDGAPGTAQSPTGEPLVPVFIPSLAATLYERERIKGEPLTELEVTTIRREAPVTLLARSEAAKLDKQRGYKDLDPQATWEAWRVFRTTLQQKSQ
jgi:hypothetical protein